MSPPPAFIRSFFFVCSFVFLFSYFFAFSTRTKMGRCMWLHLALG